MKEIEYWVSVKPIGTYEGKMTVEDDMSYSDIEERIKEEVGVSIGWYPM